MTTTDSVASLAVPEWSQVRMHRKLWFVAILWTLFVVTALANVLASFLFPLSDPEPLANLVGPNLQQKERRNSSAAKAQ